MNLTAITEEEDVYIKHFLDSYAFPASVSRETFSDGNTLIDVGTGAGFPGLPLAIAFPKLQVTLMDSLNKRIRFLDDTVNKLGLTNVKCIHARAEELGKRKEHREYYDLVVSRAVADMSVLLEYCLPFVKVGGCFAAYKSLGVGEELCNAQAAADLLGGSVCECHELILPGTDYGRTICVYTKLKSTPVKYPRRAGVPAKEPIRR